MISRHIYEMWIMVQLLQKYVISQIQAAIAFITEESEVDVQDSSITFA